MINKKNIQINQIEEKYVDENLTLHNLFEEQVLKNPEQLALFFENQTMTYKELNQRANQVAHHLLADYISRNKKIKKGVLIGLFFEPSFEMVIALLGILKAGFAYVPLDPNYPDIRLQQILLDSKTTIILTQRAHVKNHEKLLERVPAIIYLDEISDQGSPTCRENPIQTTNANDLAYILFTSGSSGRSKSIMIEHQSVVNLILNNWDNLRITTDDRILQINSINFDATVFEIFLALLHGACLYIIPSSLRRNGQEVLDYLLTHRITIAYILPFVLATLPKTQIPSLKTIFIGMGAIHESTLKFWKQNRQIINCYGPPEATIIATTCDYDDKKQPNQIGKPVKNFKLYVLDEELQPVAKDTPGELYIAGPLARGYVNQPELTAKYFILNPFITETEKKQNQYLRIYKTGDKVRWLPEGELEYLGRLDSQVDIRGFRVELGEIEHVLNAHPDVQQSAAMSYVFKEEKHILVYFIANLKKIKAKELRIYLMTQLPDYMIPSLFIPLEVFPQAPNGKIDKQQLPFPITSNFTSQYIAPRNAIEKQLVCVWEEILQKDEIGIYDNFFSLGGDSILASQLMLYVHQEYGKSISFAQFFNQPTIAMLSELITSPATFQIAKDLLTLIEKDATLDPYIKPINPSPTSFSKPKGILLTGANGFLGVYLLNELLNNTDAKIYCLLRGKNYADAEKRLIHGLNHYQFKHLVNHPRIKVILGDLTLRHLGLTIKDFNDIAENVDSIYHNGEEAHPIYSYVKLRMPNVLSTLEIIKLANTHHLKSIHYISNLSAACDIDEKGRILESFPKSVSANLENGYTVSKCVSERLLTQAQERGFNVNLYRPGNITGDSKNGIFPTQNNHLLHFIKGCIQLGYAPQSHRFVDMLPVDFIAKLIVKISLTQQGKAYNLSLTDQPRWEKIYSWIRQAGYSLDIISEKKWLHNLTTLDKKNALYPFLSFYLTEEIKRKNEPNILLHHQKVILHDHTLEALTAFNMQYPIINEKLFATYLQHLNEWLAN